jgi:hypothetical protein
MKTYIATLLSVVTLTACGITDLDQADSTIANELTTAGEAHDMLQVAVGAPRGLSAF